MNPALATSGRIEPAWDLYSRPPHLRRQFERVHALGPRVGLELLLEIVRDHQIGMVEIERRLEAYARSTPEIIAALGGNRFPPVPLTLIGGGDLS